MATKCKVDIGFVDECESWKLHSRFFPSKVGGRPAWLNLQDLPKPSEIQCAKCGEPCIFLCQIYAPLDENPNAFHRTLFVFICRNGACCEPNKAPNLHVFRCQLKRQNEFYSHEPPVEEPEDRNFDKSKITALCAVCGAKGPSHCAKCKAIKYCSRSHQVYHWKNGHKEGCGGEPVPNRKTNSLQFPEWELIIDEETAEDQSSSKTTEELEMEKYRILVEENKAGSLSNESETDLEQYTNKDVEDRAFERFKKRTERDPGQVLRYDRGGSPLWITSNNILNENDIPECPYCGSRRQFEFQIMPQLLNFLNLDLSVSSIDWGILCVYTCDFNCIAPGGAYRREFIYKQDITPDNTQ